MKKTILVLFAFCFLSGAAYLIIDFWSKHELNKITSNWPVLDRNLAEFPILFPQTPPNKSAITLHQLNTNLMEVYGKRGNEHFTDLVNSYMSASLETPSNLIDAPPEQLLSFLNSISVEFDKILSILETEEEPIFAFDPQPSPEQEIIPISWPRYLDKLLLTKALIEEKEGNTTEAWRYISVSANLIDAMFANPTLIAQMLGLAMARDTLLVMRKLTTPAPDHLTQWPDHDIKNSFLWALCTEAFYSLNLAQNGEILPLIELHNEWSKDFAAQPVSVGLWTRFLALAFERPYMRFLAAARLKGFRNQIDSFNKTGLCQSAPDLSEQQQNNLRIHWLLKSDLTETLLFGLTILEFDFSMYWNRLQQLMIHKRGAQSILQVKREKAATGVWPEQYSPVFDDCKNLSWTYSTDNKGGISFTFPQTKADNFPPSIQKEYLIYTESVSN